MPYRVHGPGPIPCRTQDPGPICPIGLGPDSMCYTGPRRAYLPHPYPGPNLPYNGQAWVLFALLGLSPGPIKIWQFSNFAYSCWSKFDLSVSFMVSDPNTDSSMDECLPYASSLCIPHVRLLRCLIEVSFKSQHFDQLSIRVVPQLLVIVECYPILVPIQFKMKIIIH